MQRDYSSIRVVRVISKTYKISFKLKKPEYSFSIKIKKTKEIYSLALVRPLVRTIFSIRLVQSFILVHEPP